MKKWLIGLLLFLPFYGQTVDLKPWYPRSLQLQGIVDYRYQSYNRLDAPGKNRHFSSDDHFVDASLMAVYDPYSIQLEIEFADTRKRNFDWDHIGVTGRYQFLDDNVGDPISLTAGVTLSRAWREALNDISSFHHGQNEAFFHMAIGKQSIHGSTWSDRWWGIIGLGIADRWTPWIVANAAYEWNQYDPHRFKVYINTLWGCGGSKLRLKDFGGYSRVNHKSIDIGAAYLYEFEFFGTVSLSYSRRVYAHNFPDNANILTIQYNYPFGPEGDYYILKTYSLLTGKKNPF